MRKKTNKLRYIRPQMEVFAVTYHQFIVTTLEGDSDDGGGAGDGDHEEVGDAKGTDFDDFEYPHYDVWEE